MSTNNLLRSLTAGKEIWLIISGGFIAHIIISTFIPVGFDEAYYGAYSFNLNWGYFDHPPMVAIIAGMGHWLSCSFSYLSLRAGSIVTFIFTSIIIYKLTEELFNKEVGRISFIRNKLVAPYALKAFPCILIWIKISYEIMKF